MESTLLFVQPPPHGCMGPSLPTQFYTSCACNVMLLQKIILHAFDESVYIIAILACAYFNSHPFVLENNNPR